jgi:hypothetical protein
LFYFGPLGLGDDDGALMGKANVAVGDALDAGDEVEPGVALASIVAVGVGTGVGVGGGGIIFSQ